MTDPKNLIAETLGDCPCGECFGMDGALDIVAALDKAGLVIVDKAVPEALRSIDRIANLGREINPSNYDHDDVLILNQSWIDIVLAVEAALATLELL